MGFCFNETERYKKLYELLWMAFQLLLSLSPLNLEFDKDDQFLLCPFI